MKINIKLRNHSTETWPVRKKPVNRGVVRTAKVSEIEIFCENG